MGLELAMQERAAQSSQPTLTGDKAKQEAEFDESLKAGTHKSIGYAEARLAPFTLLCYQFFFAFFLICPYAVQPEAHFLMTVCFRRIQSQSLPLMIPYPDPNPESGLGPDQVCFSLALLVNLVVNLIFTKWLHTLPMLILIPVNIAVVAPVAIFGSVYGQQPDLPWSFPYPGAPTDDNLFWLFECLAFGLATLIIPLQKLTLASYAPGVIQKDVLMHMSSGRSQGASAKDMV